MNDLRKIQVMGIVNLTDDSFYQGSRCLGVAEAVNRVSEMLEAGADIIDFGACSTRPGSSPVGAEEEWRRLAPVLAEVHGAFPDAEISIDTYFSSVVSKAYDLIGDFIINDISAGEDDPMMLKTAGLLGLTYVAMHKRGTPADMQEFTDYNDVVSDVISYFRDFAEKAQAAGIRNWILDPGFGFAKTLEQNWELMRGLSDLKALCRESGGPQGILAGVSRKSMICRLLDIAPEQSLSATQVAHLMAIEGGADILRVHDVAETVQTVRLYNCLNGNIL